MFYLEPAELEERGTPLLQLGQGRPAQLGPDITQPLPPVVEL